MDHEANLKFFLCVNWILKETNDWIYTSTSSTCVTDTTDAAFMLLKEFHQPVETRTGKRALRGFNNYTHVWYQIVWYDTCRVVLISYNLCKI